MALMIPEVKQKWIEALLSGKYEQGRDYLVKDNKYCCLGVLRDVVEPGSVEVYGNSEVAGEGKEYFQKTSYLQIKHRGGLTNTDAIALAGMNDKGFTFSQIAEYIQTHN